MAEGDWKQYVPVDVGYVCGTCGLSDFGRDRFLTLGFHATARPCGTCRDHFTPVLGPPSPDLHAGDGLPSRQRPSPLVAVVPGPADQLPLQ